MTQQRSTETVWYIPHFLATFSLEVLSTRRFCQCTPLYSFFEGGFLCILGWWISPWLQDMLLESCAQPDGMNWNDGVFSTAFIFKVDRTYCWIFYWNDSNVSVCSCEYCEYSRACIWLYTYSFMFFDLFAYITMCSRYLWYYTYWDPSVTISRLVKLFNYISYIYIIISYIYTRSIV